MHFNPDRAFAPTLPAQPQNNTPRRGRAQRYSAQRRPGYLSACPPTHTTSRSDSSTPNPKYTRDPKYLREQRPRYSGEELARRNSQRQPLTQIFSIQFDGYT